MHVLSTVLLLAAATETFDIPDPFLIRRECSAAERALPDARGTSRDIEQEIADACRSMTKKFIDPDDWMDRVYLLRSGEGQVQIPPTAFVPVRRRAIPKSFAVYSMLLVPSLQSARAPERADFIRALKEYGKAIGDERAAILFVDAKGDIDVQRSKYYCDLLRLDYNRGPYLVTSHKRPDLMNDRDEKIVIRFSGITSKRAIAVLNILEQDLRRDAEIRRRSLLYEEVKARLLTLLDRQPQLRRAVIAFILGSK
jgi:hypothetical protein